MAVSTKIRAVTTKKLKSSTVKKVKWPTMKRHVLDQVLGMPHLGQRNQGAQVENGWDHIKGVPLSSQSTFHVATFTGKYAKHSPAQYILVDGFHRIWYWYKDCDDDCPFADLNMEIHTLHADTEEEADELLDELARSFNSYESVKRNVHFLTAAVRDAGLMATSRAYLTGTRAASFLKRAIGNPKKLSTPALTALAGMHIGAHGVMDKLYHFTEQHKSVKSKVAQVFHVGIAYAIFERLTMMDTKAQLAAFVEIKDALAYATESNDLLGNGGKVSKVVQTLAADLQRLANPKVHATIKARCRNQEQFYTEVTNELSTALVGLGKIRRTRLAAV